MADDLDFDFESAPEFTNEVAAVTQVGRGREELARLEGPEGDGPGAPDLPKTMGRGVPMMGGDNKHRNFRQTVCIHWLRGLCMKGESCGFLHSFDKERMPVCRTFAKFGECKEADCPYKHNYDAIKTCNMYNLGLCIHGPQCRYRHERKAGPPPDPQQVVDSLRGTRFFPDGLRMMQGRGGPPGPGMRGGPPPLMLEGPGGGRGMGMGGPPPMFHGGPPPMLPGPY